ncbi:peptide/nickel transport system permease protein [Natronoarchaeum philippinense]|uniref:Peptide/nickel transport system permease protein n=2 Tax=Natronoarchaeum philippinense TaxID=558529 RepID=A0A285P518_NATPI|nr:peptide/nickel transport system permease protein [Natronoarchaeum philippinense]
MADGGDVQSSDIPLGSVSVEDVSRWDRLAKQFRGYWETFLLAWSDWRFKAGFLVLLGFVYAGTVGVYTTAPPTYQDGGKWDSPSYAGENPLGTDQFGQDILAVLIHATPDMLLMLIGGAVFATGIGAAVGIISGYKGGRVDEIMMTLTDTAMMIPGLPLIIIVGAIWEPTSPILVGILVSINAWAGTARSLRSQVLTIREEEYVEASRIMGVSSGTIMRKDITPQLLPLILVNFVMSGRGVIFNSVALYFLGVLPVEGVNWGVMLQKAYDAGAVTSSELYYTVLWPLLTIVLLSWGLIMLSQGLDRVVNVRVRDRHEGGESK